MKLMNQEKLFKSRLSIYIYMIGVHQNEKKKKGNDKDRYRNNADHKQKIHLLI
jgi:hypothetical protein